MRSRTVLWGARAGDVQVGSARDHRQQAGARLFRRLYLQRAANRRLAITLGKAGQEYAKAVERMVAVMGRSMAEAAETMRANLARMSVKVGER